MKQPVQFTRRCFMLAGGAAATTTGAVHHPALAQSASVSTRLFQPSVRAGDFGFAAADARGADGSLDGTREASAQVARSLDNLRINLRTIGQELNQVVSVWVLLKNYSDLAAVSQVLDERYPDPQRSPAVTFLGVSDLDGDCVVRLDAVASSNADRRPINVPGIPLARGGRVHGVYAGGIAFLSGVDAGDVKGGSPDDTMHRQTYTVLDRIDKVLRTQGLELSDVGRTFMFMNDLRVRSSYSSGRQERYKGVFDLDKFPANSGIGVPNLGSGAMLRSVAIAARPKSFVVSERVRLSPGSFSQSVRMGDFLFIAGQDAFDLQRQNEHVGDLAGQTTRTLDYLRYIVEAAGATLDDVVKTTNYLVAGQDRTLFTDAYRRYFETHTRGSWLPNGLTLDVQELSTRILVEIDAVVYLGQRR
jgi:enamine deaminase RidA (YjgF/YER057c/UK114 family)